VSVKDTNNSVVVMDNTMVKAKFGKLTDIESRFIFFAISQIKYVDTEFKTFRFSVGRLLKELDMPGKNYTFLFGVLKNMVERTIAFPDEKGFTIFPWFSMLRVEKKEMIGIRFNDMLKPYLLELRKNFTKAELSLILQMKNHTRRIYLMCKQYLNMGGFEKDINALRTELELGDIYKQYKYLARDILIPARDEINKLADLRCSFEPVRVGRSYSLLSFKVWPAPTSNKSIGKNAGASGKNTPAQNKQIEEKRRKADAEHQEQLAKDSQMALDLVMKDWDKKCKELEPYLVRKSEQWEHCLDTINGALGGAASFDTWFVITELFFDDRRNAYILTPNNLSAKVIHDNYLNFIAEVLTKNKIGFVTIKIVTPDIKNQFVNAVSDESTGEEDIAAEDLDQQPSLFAEAEQTTLF